MDGHKETDGETDDAIAKHGPLGTAAGNKVRDDDVCFTVAKQFLTNFDDA